MTKWHNLNAAEALRELGANTHGLTSAEAQTRLARFGPNLLAEKGGTSPWLLLLEQFKSFLVIILLFAVVLSAVVGETVDAIIIGVIVLFASGLGFVQEYRAERAMEALKRMAAPVASVLRDGKEAEIPARDLVPGDVVILRTGNRIPADARLLESVNLKTNEAPLTGESVPVEKITSPVAGDANIGDRRNMVFMGTNVVYGRGTAIVTGTGMATEFGAIAGMLQEVKTERTPLQDNLDKMGKRIAIAGLSLTFVLATLGVLRGREILEMFVWGVALAVAAVPEALPAVVVISLALGVRRMVKRHALIRRLPAVETLGSTTVICSDKTGTMTQDEMTVKRVYADGKSFAVSGTGYEPKGSYSLGGEICEVAKDPELVNLLRIGSLCNDSTLVQENSRWGIKGDPTEGALIVAAAKAGILAEAEAAQYPRTREIPFPSDTKMMTTAHKTPGGEIAYSKGAPEVILERCKHVYSNKREANDKDRADILAIAQEMAGEGLRVLGLACKPIADPNEPLNDGLTFAGLVGMIDPPRPEVKQSIKVCEEAGIKTMMITGDHKLTAMAIARELGLLDEGEMAVSGADLDGMSDAELDRLVEQIKVYARVSPEHKLRVVDALQKKGHVVAMTGDGVNDAPALKKADIGVAMGITGTDVSKEAAAMVLTDDNFASIVSAVEEGRGVYDNIKKFLMYLLASNVGEVLLMLVSFIVTLIMGVHVLPLVALQILWINLVTDGLPALALAVDPAEPDIMQRPPPRNPRQSIFTRPVVTFIGGIGLWTMAAALGVFLWALLSGRDPVQAQALVFATLVVLELFNCFNCRSDRYSLFKVNPFANRWLLGAIAISLMLSLVVIYIPFLQGPFHTYALGLADWGVVLLAGVSVIVAAEIGKLTASRWRSPK